MLTLISRQTIPLKSKSRSTRTHMLMGVRESTCHVICTQPLHLCNLSRQVINDLTTHPQLVLRARSPPISIFPTAAETPFPSLRVLSTCDKMCLCSVETPLYVTITQITVSLWGDQWPPRSGRPAKWTCAASFTDLVNRPPFHNGGLFFN